MAKHDKAKQDKEVVQSALTLLTTTAMALPGVASAVTPPEKPEFGFRWEKYLEDDTLAEDSSIAQDTERYDIDAFYFDLVLPLTEKVAFVGKMDYETMSGATPWYVIPPGGLNQQEPTVVNTTGASVDDQRLDVSGTGTYYVSSDTAVSGTFGFSTEEDYNALYGGMGVVLEFYNKHVTADFGISFSSDKLSPTPSDNTLPAGVERIDDASKGTFSVYAGYTQVLNRISTFQTGVSYTAKHGYLTDPYKLVAVVDPGDNGIVDVTDNVVVENENRPIDRKQLAWVARYRLYLERLSTAVHLDYRYYSDNWEIYSNTVESSLHFRWKQLLLVGGFRYYTQTAVDFYDLYFTESCTDRACSSDYRLSEFDAVSYRFRVEYELGNITPVFSFEHYDATGDSPAIIDFNVLALGFDWKF